MNKNIFNYHLPKELIAQTPLERRSDSRLLIYNRKTNKQEHKHFYDICDYFNEGDCLVINNTKVIPARLNGEKENSGAKIEVFLLKNIGDNTYEILAKPLKRLHNGDKVWFNWCLDNNPKYDVYGIFIAPNKMKFNISNILDYGEVPLPHYINNKSVKMDRYNTIYSKCEGSVAAPTAGLHFTDDIFTKLKAKGVKIANITLHVGLGTFLPVKTDNILEHTMHSEYYEITKENADIINSSKRVVAVGTTSVRTLEAVYKKHQKIIACTGETDIFIYPPYEFKIVNSVITNFHLPES
ncbi:MAG: tRNA preQ1(34) S-adenosylmethionine ribosyltransferase-isomerase QueA, partial [Firmicutes bacterium]|nr:tRNA preQ1(34) S-adenosylmethionine ribosyltransferase-isomerase QueA [Bacillota bacterium]